MNKLKNEEMLLLGQHLTAIGKDGRSYEGEIFYFSEEAVVLRERVERGCRFTMINLETCSSFKIR